MIRAGSSGPGHVRAARLLSGLVTVLAVLVIVTACGSGSDGGATPSPSPSPPSAPAGSGPAGNGSAVEVKNFMFTPTTLTVPADATVTWTFGDSTEHTVAANDNSFSSSPLANGKTFTHTFSTAGPVAYHCSIHPFMLGTITVR